MHYSAHANIHYVFAIQGLPLSRRNHLARDLAVLPRQSQLSLRRREARLAGYRRDVRDDPPMVSEVRPVLRE